VRRDDLGIIERPRKSCRCAVHYAGVIMRERDALVSFSRRKHGALRVNGDGSETK